MMIPYRDKKDFASVCAPLPLFLYHCNKFTVTNIYNPIKLVTPEYGNQKYLHIFWFLSFGEGCNVI